MPGRRWTSLLLASCTLTLLAFASPASAVEAEVTNGSNDAVFSQNKQNEPGLAVDQGRVARGQPPLVLAAGANDNIDMEACNAGDDTTCPFTPNVGGTGISFSFDGGTTWKQPQYTGWTARHCLGLPGPDDPECEVRQGPIGTLPRYDELGLVSDGDPALAFGPRPGANGFSWTNGSRLYVANLTSAVSADFRETKKPAFKGFEAIYVSRTDNAEQAAQDGAAGEAAWMLPVRVSRQSSATFADKEQIWADNAQSSRFFGYVYVCWADFRGAGAAPLVVARSANGGNTWLQRQVSPAHNVAPRHFGQSGCTVRTDSTGVAYAFYEEFQDPTKIGFPPQAVHMMVKSFNGGWSWTRPRAINRVVDPCYRLDPVINRCVMDGIAGARSDLAAAPSVD
ncbi:MAG: exo-alpha-sialidase, partial [Actinobacteria bacterium]|nr:exo-alpha-sialidase [Actinomycetota bacterium]